MLKTEKQNLLGIQNYVRHLSQKYSPSLLGYIYSVTGDREKSEEYLVMILSQFVVDFNTDVLNKNVTWLKLRQYACNFLSMSAFVSHTRIEDKNKQLETGFPENVYLSLLDQKQKEIFCAIYYHGKSINDLATALQENETFIRNQFKLSLDKIRNARGN
ncbi:hypothetical protein ACJVDH_01225 [Pedobacter sp. AW1-32]|uniref:hypothetical protein n=1 Tax=Pedobacter sp. AW1-32 TaxID=3383026 RepID=UPI003FEE6D23